MIVRDEIEAELLSRFGELRSLDSRGRLSLRD